MSRSLAACLACRRQKVRCSGLSSSDSSCLRCQKSNAECTFVKPRQAGSGLLLSLDETDQQVSSDRLNQLEKRLAELAQSSSDALMELRNDVTRLNQILETNSQEPLKQPYLPLENDMRISQPVMIMVDTSHLPNLVQKQIITQLQFVGLFEYFSQHCNDIISFLDPIETSLEIVQGNPLLAAAICSIGAKASASSLHDACKQETQFCIQQTLFGDVPTLDTIKGILLYVAWYGSKRVLGLLITLSYELGFHSAAENLSTESIASWEQVEKARTWLTCCCFDLLMNITGSVLISNLGRYVKLGTFLCASEHARRVDHRIKANIELFGLAVEARNTPFSIYCFAPLSDEAASTLHSLSSKVDSWFERMNIETEPLYQTFSEIQDRNRAVIPYAMLSMYINGLSIHQVSPESELHPSHSSFVQTAIKSAITVLDTAVKSPSYRRNLRSAINYNSNGLFLALNFLYKSALMIYRDKTIEPIVEIFQQVTQMLDKAGVLDHAENVRAKANVLLQLSCDIPTMYDRTETSSWYLSEGHNLGIEDMDWGSSELHDGFTFESEE